MMTDEDSRMRDFMLTFRKMLLFFANFLRLVQSSLSQFTFFMPFWFFEFTEAENPFYLIKEWEREIDKKKNICFLIWGLWRIFNQAFRHYYFYALKKRKKKFFNFFFLFIRWREQKITQICQRVKVSVTNMLH